MSQWDTCYIGYLEGKFDQDIIHQQKPLIIGDFNIDLSKQNNDANRMRIIAKATELKQIIKDPTRITMKSSPFLDHIYTNELQAVEVQRIFPIITDHEIIGIQISLGMSMGKCLCKFGNLNPDIIDQISIELLGANLSYTSINVNNV